MSCRQLSVHLLDPQSHVTATRGSARPVPAQAAILEAAPSLKEEAKEIKDYDIFSKPDQLINYL